MPRTRPHRTLGQYDRSDDASPQARQARARLSRPDNRDPETVARQDKMGSGDCWCGGPPGHDWPGKAEGKPHPR